MPKGNDLKKRLDEIFSAVTPADDAASAPAPAMPEPVEPPEPSAGRLAAAAAEPLRTGPEAIDELMGTVFNHATVGMLITGLDGRIRRANLAFCQMLGYPQAEIDGREFQSLTFVDDLPVGSDVMRAMLSGKAHSAQFSKRYVHADGSLVWVELNVTLLRDEAGHPLNFFTVVRDVTREHNTEAQLEKRLRELHCLSDIGHKVDERPRLDEFLTWAAGRITTAFMYPEDCVAAIEVGGQVFGDPGAKELPSRSVGGLRVSKQAVAGGAAEEPAGEGELVGWLYIAYRQPHDFADSESALIGEIVSRLSGYIESQSLMDRMASELAERTRAEAALQESDLRLTSIVNFLPDAMMVIDTQGRVIAWSRAMEELSGVKEADMLGKGDYEYAVPFYGERRPILIDIALLPEDVLREQYAQFERAGDILYGESHLINFRGRETFLAGRASLLRNTQGQVVGSIEVVQDVTTRRLAEASLQKRASEMETVAQVGTAAATILDPNRLLQEVVDLTRQRFNLYHVHVYLLDARGAAGLEALRLAAGSGEAGRRMVSQGWSIPLDSEQSLVARAARQRRGVIVNDVHADPGFLPNDLLPDTAAEMAVPLLAGNELLGVLDIQSNQREAFSEQDVTVQTTLAYQIAVALQNARLYERNRSALADAEALYGGSSRIAGATTTQAILQALLDATELKHLDRANIIFFDRPWGATPPENLIVSAVWEHSGQPTRFPPGTAYPLGRFPAFQLLERDQPVVLADIETDPRVDANLKALLTSAAMRSLVAFPLVAGGDWIGIVTGQSAGPLHLAEEQIRRINSLMDQASTVAQNLRLIEQVQSSLAEARQSREQYQLAVEGSQEGIWDWNIQTGEVYYSPRWKALIGYEPDELENNFTEYEQRIHPEDHDRVIQVEQDYLAGKLPAYEVEFRMVHKDGSYRWIHGRGSAIWDDRGTPVRMAGSHADITASKEADLELERQRQLMRTLIDNIYDYIYIKDRQSRFLLNNQAHLRLLGMTAQDQAVGKTDMDVFPSEDAQVYFEDEQGLMERGEDLIDREEATEDQTTGERKWMLTTKVPLRDANGQVYGLAGLTRDVTQQKRSEELLARRATQLTAVAQVSASVTSLLNPDELLQSVVDLTRQQFGLYHAHIYLLDPESQNLVLAAGAGETGRKMMAQGWEIPLLRRQSLVARAARDRQAVIVNDVRQDPAFLPNILLPDTRAELAAPLLVGSEVLGVLDVQSDQASYFSQEDADVMVTLAAQIGIALQNARRYDEVRSSERLVRSITAATPDWIFVKDLQHRFLMVNEAFAHAMGYKPEEFLGKNDVEVGFSEEMVMGNPDKGIQGYWWDDQKVMDSAKPVVTNGEPNMIDDIQHFFDVYKAPLFDDRGRVTGMLGFARDVTERERLLSAAERQAQTLTILNEMSRALTATPDLPAVLRAIYEYASRMMDTENFYIALFDDAAQMVSFPLVYLNGARDESTAPRPLGQFGFTDYIITHQEVVWFDRDVQERAAAYGIAFRSLGDDAPAVSWLGVPMIYGGLVSGVIAVQSIHTPGLYTERERDLLHAIAVQAANAIALVQQYQQTQQALLSNRVLLSQIQAQVQREQALREISTHVRSVMDPEIILRTAVRELGDALGRRTFVRLGTPGSLGEDGGASPGGASPGGPEDGSNGKPHPNNNGGERL